MLWLCELLYPSPSTLKVRLNRIYFTEIENWKHCNKIIFKCVNSTVRPIFNEKIAEKWSLWVYEQCTDALFTEDLVNNYGWKKKEKKKMRAWKT